MPFMQAGKKQSSVQWHGQRIDKKVFFLKKIISVILSLIILISSFSVCSFAIDYDWLENDRSFKNYKDLLYDIYYNPEKYVEGDSSVENDYFAIADINDDGIDELIVKYIYHAMAFQYMSVWTYDRSIGRVKLFNIFDESTTFYTTGYAKTDWSHNQMMSFPIWPYTITSIDSSDDMTINVEAYKSGESYYREEYEALEDADNDGIVYVVEYNNDSVLIPLTYSEYRAFEDKYIPNNALIFDEYDYELISTYSIAYLEADYGSDLPVNGTMTGDLNGDNKVTAADARSVLRFAAKIDIPNDTQKSLADVDGNGKITAADARKILRVAAKLDEFDDNEQDVVQPPVPAADFNKLNDAFIATGCVPFDCQYSDASYIIENILFNGYYPSGYSFYSDDYSELQDNYYDNNMDPYNWFPYYYIYDAETVRWICEEIYHVECSKNSYWSSNSYFYDGKLYVNSGGPSGGEGDYWIVIDNYSINSEGKYEIYADRYYNSGFYGEPDEFTGSYFIVADWQEIDGEYYWTFYSVEEL